MPAHEYFNQLDMEALSVRLGRTVPEVRELAGQGKLRACRLAEAPPDSKRVENFGKTAYDSEKLNALASKTSFQSRSSGKLMARLSAQSTHVEVARYSK